MDDELCCLPLSQLNPTLRGFMVKVKFDRPFKREIMRSIGLNRTPMKELLSLDIVVYDEQGTTMVFRLISEDQRDRFACLFQCGREVEICNPVVKEGGHGINDEYHLVAHCATKIYPAIAVFPAFPFKIVSSVDLALGKAIPRGLFDIVGFATVVIPLTNLKSDHDWQPELRLQLGLYRDDLGWVKSNCVVCVLRGSWVEEIADLIKTEPEQSDPPFIHLRYVQMEQPYRMCAGVKLMVTTFSYASKVYIDPPIPAVQDVKEDMLRLKHIDM